MHAARARRPGSSCCSSASRALKDAPAPLPAALTAGDFTHVTITLGLTHDVCQATDTSHRRNTAGRSCRAGLKQPSRKAKAEPSQEPTFDAGCKPVPGQHGAALANTGSSWPLSVLLAALQAWLGFDRASPGLAGVHFEMEKRRGRSTDTSRPCAHSPWLKLPWSSNITSSKQMLSQGTKA